MAMLFVSLQQLFYDIIMTMSYAPPQLGNNTLPLMLSKIHSKLTLQIAQGHLSVPHQPRQIQLHRQKQQKGKEGKSSLQQSRNLSHFKSEFSPEDKKRIKELKDKIVVFQQKLEKKSKEANEIQKIQAEKERIQQNKRLREEWDRHRQAALIRKQQRWLQKKQQSLLKNQQKTSKASNKRILYKQIEREKHVQQQMQQRSRAELLSVLSQQRRNLVNISKLGEHQKSYVQKMKEEKLDRMRKMEEIRETTRRLEESQIRNSLKSKFYDRVVTQIEEQKKGFEQAQRQKKKSQQKLRQFLEKIRSESAFIAQKHKKQRKTTNTKQQSSSSIIGRRSITQIELHQIGNRFLRDSLRHIAKNGSKRSMSTQPQPQPFKRNNYLQQLKQNRIKTQGDSNILLFHQGKIQKILASPGSRQQKVEKLKKLAHRLQAGSASSDTEAQLQKIHAKMKILDATLKASQ